MQPPSGLAALQVQPPGVLSVSPASPTSPTSPTSPVRPVQLPERIAKFFPPECGFRVYCLQFIRKLTSKKRTAARYILVSPPFLFQGSEDGTIRRVLLMTELMSVEWNRKEPARAIFRADPNSGERDWQFDWAEDKRNSLPSPEAVIECIDLCRRPYVYGAPLRVCPPTSDPPRLLLQGDGKTVHQRFAEIRGNPGLVPHAAKPPREVEIPAGPTLGATWDQDENHVVRVTGVAPGQPFDRAGVPVGARLVTVAGEPATNRVMHRAKSLGRSFKVRYIPPRPGDEFAALTREDENRLKEFQKQREAGNALEPDDETELACLERRYSHFLREGEEKMRRQSPSPGRATPVASNRARRRGSGEPGGAAAATALAGAPEAHADPPADWEPPAEGNGAAAPAASAPDHPPQPAPAPSASAPSHTPDLPDLHVTSGSERSRPSERKRHSDPQPPPQRRPTPPELPPRAEPCPPNPGVATVDTSVPPPPSDTPGSPGTVVDSLFQDPANPEAGLSSGRQLVDDPGDSEQVEVTGEFTQLDPVPQPPQGAQEAPAPQRAPDAASPPPRRSPGAAASAEGDDSDDPAGDAFPAHLWRLPQVPASPGRASPLRLSRHRTPPALRRPHTWLDSLFDSAGP
eukprot:TRINITY_DN9777_c0_g2_i1.p1 TRINITY_DN9777_c0_g2~~TRINITY_DN9777_c0_g2_i1.p1  ORF type:complete len:660 (+),score=126.69 TRINITY_DN9777_c0_g2_i1:93-1982(+)